MLNRKVLSSRRKVRPDETVRRETGRVFHARAAATGNARSPRLDRLVAGTNKVDVEPDLKCSLLSYNIVIIYLLSSELQITVFTTVFSSFRFFVYFQLSLFPSSFLVLLSQASYLSDDRLFLDF